MIKYPKIREEIFLKEEMEYIQSDAHEVSIRDIFELANIDHGRIDYGIVDGKIQVLAINTNPHMVYFEGKGDPRSEANKVFFRKYVKALEDINMPSQKSIKCQVDIPVISKWSLRYGNKILKGIVRRLKEFAKWV
jgi:hypothetical protein